MKRFLLFSGSFYYPSGGWSDFRDSYDTREEALAAIPERTSDWWQIVDTQVGRIVNEGVRK